MGRFVSGLALLAIATASLLAQGERGALNGTITDPNGAAVPGASVSARNIGTGIEFKAVSTDAGVFRLSSLPAGNYRISATAKGFRTSVAERVDLAVAQTLTVDLKLEIGQVNEQVTVSSEPPLIETGTAEIGRYVTEREFDTWPIAVGDGRRQIQSFIFRSLPGTTGGEFARAAKDSFVDGLSQGLLLGAGVVAIAAFVAYRFLPAAAHDELVVSENAFTDLVPVAGS